ncbi:AsmA family protein [Halocynthiibacter sp. C4]|uniref:AsmA family protein n=1 Tax=Halocynthiibacter sp. C4 TaxID=2992758 RepID=UPI00237B8660|nr:AsmA family protein [Halocynthiibacter sp. C4]MDE0591531.1 AsmA family protein [Halocynthiibacter sp. C4]
MRILLFLLKALVFLVIVGVVGIWMFLSSGLFEERRQAIVSSLLTEAFGQPVEVNGTLKIAFGRIMTVTAAGVEIPSEDIENETLARLDLLEFDIDPVKYFQDDITLDTFIIDGLSVNLLTLEDGRHTWTTQPENAEKEESTGDVDKYATGIAAFVSRRTIDVTGVSIVVDNKSTGFVFDFQLASLLFHQIDDRATLEVSGSGTVNGEEFTVSGLYPDGKPFTTNASFSSASLSFNGTTLPSEAGPGYTGELNFDVNELSDLFDVLKLENSVKGEGHLTSRLTRQPGGLKAQDIDLHMNFDDGKSVQLSGAVEDLFTMVGVDVTGDVALYPEGEEPPRAKKLKDFRLLNFSAHWEGDAGDYALNEINVGTNYFVKDFNEIGPISVGRIYRTPDSKLSLQDVHVQVGPLGTPFLSADGDLEDLLAFEGLTLEGALDVPASLVLKNFGQEGNEAFGRLDASFSVTDEPGHLAITNFSGRTRDSDIWNLGLEFELAEVTKMKGLHIGVDLGVPDSAAFAGALGDDVKDAGPLSLLLDVTGDGPNIEFITEVTAGESDLNLDLTTSHLPQTMEVRGALSSPELRIDDFKNAITWSNALVDNLVAEREDEDGEESDKPEESFVLEPESEPVDDKPEESFVVADDKPEESFVVDPSALYVPLTKKEALHWVDVDVAIDVPKITGQAGVSRIESELTVKDAIARLGPLEFSYGGGYFNAAASVDLDNSPKYARVNGRASGWELSDLMELAGVDMDARGKPSLQFNLGATYTSLPAILASLNGNVQVSMGQGAVATSLLELAGLGIFRWLFSDELGQGYTRVGCVEAPLTINAGRISTDVSVLETESVQLLLLGGVDLKQRTIDLRGEPRALGKPLARAPFPFSVTGSLDDPNFDIKFSGSRVRRSDGATQMPANRKPCVADILQLQ